jgi:hypothetical protein
MLAFFFIYCREGHPAAWNVKVAWEEAVGATHASPDTEDAKE